MPSVLNPALHGTSSLRQQYQRPLLTLLALSGLVLLVACVNLANLFFAKGAARREELSLRACLGASRGRLIRLLLVESASVATIGAGLGLLFARWAGEALVARLSTGEPSIALDLSLDARILMFTGAATVLTTLAFGLAPALRATGTTASEALKQGGRGVTGSTSHGTSNVLLVGQVAISLALVIAAGLLVRSAQQLARAPLGFDDEGLLTVTVTAPTIPAAERNAFYHRLVAAVAAMPGVGSVGGALDGPLTMFSAGIPLSLSGTPPVSTARTTSQFIPITPGWREAYRMPIRDGRDVDGRDVKGAEPVMLVNEALVRRFFPHGPVIGRTVTVTLDVPPTGALSLGPKTIVGIVGDAVYSSLREPVPPTVYVPLAQRDGPLFLSVFFMAVRPSSGVSSQFAGKVTTALRGVNADLKIKPRLASEQVGGLLAQDRLVAQLAIVTSVQALLLAAVGLYGVTAFTVHQRRKEMGIRLALGGTPTAVVRLVLARVMALLLAGLLIGCILGLWTGSLLAPLLYGLGPGDPLTFLVAASSVALVGMLSGLIPAVRASRIDPMLPLRS